MNTTHAHLIHFVRALCGHNRLVDLDEKLALRASALNVVVGLLRLVQ